MQSCYWTWLPLVNLVLLRRAGKLVARLLLHPRDIRLWRLQSLALELYSIHVLVGRIEYLFHVHTFAIGCDSTAKRKLILRMTCLIPPARLPRESFGCAYGLLVRRLRQNDQ